MPSLDVELLHENFGAKVHGIDLTQPLDAATVAAIRDAVDDYSLLCFPDQPMSDEAHLAFTRQLGQPEAEHVTLGKTGRTVYFGTVGNVADDGTVRRNADANTKYQTGNEQWHSDSSFRAVPSFVSITHAYEVPGEDGATLFASMRSAYERLPQAMKDTIEPLSAVHDYVFSRSPIAPVDPNHAASLPPVVHPVVRRNPATGAANYYTGSHARSIVGWSGMDGRALIDDLNRRATQDRDVYSHYWAAGDTVIWDNRCLLHRGGGYDADKWRRRMRQTRVAGPSTVT